MFNLKNISRPVNGHNALCFYLKDLYVPNENHKMKTKHLCILLPATFWHQFSAVVQKMLF